MSEENAARETTIKYLFFVQEVIEKYLIHYELPTEQIPAIIARNTQIELPILEQVLKNLEDNNKEFFRGYQVKVELKKQIIRFTELNERLKLHPRHYDEVMKPISNLSDDGDEYFHEEQNLSSSTPPMPSEPLQNTPSTAYIPSEPLENINNVIGERTSSQDDYMSLPSSSSAISTYHEEVLGENGSVFGITTDPVDMGEWLGLGCDIFTPLDLNILKI